MNEVIFLDSVPPPHEIATWFPELSPDAFATLNATVEKNGIQNPITIHEGKLLDGRQRARAAQAKGLPIPARQLPEGIDPIDYVVMQNVERRHLNSGQLAMLAIRLTDRKRVTNGSVSTSAKDNAELVGTSTRSAKRARRVMDNSPPEIAEAVSRGTIELADAERQCERPAEEQRQALKQVTSGRAKRLTKAQTRNDDDNDPFAALPNDNGETERLLDPTLPAKKATATPPASPQGEDATRTHEPSGETASEGESAGAGEDGDGHSSTFDGTAVAEPSAAQIERARDALGEIDVDPASSEEAQDLVQAARAHSPLDPNTNWEGRVWLRLDADTTWASETLRNAIDAVEASGDARALVVDIHGKPQEIEGLGELLRSARRIVVPYPEDAPTLVVLTGDHADTDAFEDAWEGAGAILSSAERAH